MMLIEIEQPFDLATSLTMGQAFRWRPLGDGWYSGVLKQRLVHLRQTPDGLEYRVGGPDGEIAAVDLDHELRRYFRLDTDDIESIYVDLDGRDRRIGPLLERHHGVRVLRQEPMGMHGVVHLLGACQRRKHHQKRGGSGGGIWQTGGAGR